MARETKEVRVGTVDEFTSSALKIVDIDGVEVGIVRMNNGEFRAVRNICPHRGAPICKGFIGGTWPPSDAENLKYDLDGQVLVCPWHGFEFNLNDGQELFQTPATRLRMYPITTKGDDVYVAVARRGLPDLEDEKPGDAL
jgi:nitrite reductase (NADH) small subunit